MSGVEKRRVRMDTYFGTRLIESELLPEENSVYIFNPAALKAEVSWQPLESEPVDFASSMTRMRYEIRLGFDPADYTYEDVPCVQIAAHDSFRSWLRSLGALIGYDHRKATGKLRRWPRSVGVITGIA